MRTRSDPLDSRGCLPAQLFVIESREGGRRQAPRSRRATLACGAALSHVHACVAESALGSSWSAETAGPVRCVVRLRCVAVARVRLSTALARLLIATRA
jgi:hypothetical protein